MLKQLVLILVVVLSACASVKPLEQNMLEGIGKEVVVAKRKMPDFKAVEMTGAFLFGPIGVLAVSPSQYEAGNLLVRENNISDPAYQIAESLARSMETKYGLKYKGVGENIITDDEVRDIATAYKGTPLVIDVKTIYWAFAPVPFNFGKYRVVYHARLRIVDTKNVTVIAEGRCDSLPEKTDDAPTYEALIGDGANRLKSELEKESQYCIHEFSSKYLGI